VRSTPNEINSNKHMIQIPERRFNSSSSVFDDNIALPVSLSWTLSIVSWLKL
jgi:hypothetical protein